MVFEIGQWTVVESAQDIGAEGIREAAGAPKNRGAVSPDPVLRGARQAAANQHDVQPKELLKNYLIFDATAGLSPAIV